MPKHFSNNVIFFKPQTLHSFKDPVQDHGSEINESLAKEESFETEEIFYYMMAHFYDSCYHIHSKMSSLSLSRTSN